VLAQIQAQVVNLQQSVNAAVLQAAKIMDPASQAHALSAINAVATIVSAILALGEFDQQQGGDCADGRCFDGEAGDCTSLCRSSAGCWIYPLITKMPKAFRQL